MEVDRSKWYVAHVQWMNEDELPTNIGKPQFDAMFELSKVDIVRLYPYIEFDGMRIFLAAS